MALVVTVAAAAEEVDGLASPPAGVETALLFEAGGRMIIFVSSGEIFPVSSTSVCSFSMSRPDFESLSTAWW